MRSFPCRSRHGTSKLARWRRTSKIGDDSPANVELGGEQGAWLEETDGKRLPIQGNLSIGRSPKNSLVLDSQKISRRHAIINVQNVGEFWLIDLGSSNGTFLNKRRVHQPLRLCDFDQIIIGDYVFTFRQPIELTGEYQSTVIERTIREIENVPCWLLVADIENFTPLSRSLTSDKLATLIGGWVATCKEIIEAHEGMIDKYLGDGFFALLARGRERGDKGRRCACSAQTSSSAQRAALPARLALWSRGDRRCSVDG